MQPHLQYQPLSQRDPGVSIDKDGHDPGRCSVGICVELNDPVKRQALVDHNRDLTQLSPFMPPLWADLMRYEILAATHYNTCLRLGRESCKSPAGDLGSLLSKDAS